MSFLSNLLATTNSGQQEEEDDLQVFSTSACKNVERADDVTAPVKLKMTSLNLNPDEEETNFNTQTENPADPKTINLEKSQSSEHRRMSAACQT